MSGTNEELTFLSWHEMDEMIRSTAQLIKENVLPDVIIAIQRGGFIPGVILSHRLGVRDVIPLHVRVTDSDEINAGKSAPRLTINEDIARIHNKNVLLVDDIAGSGATYKKAVEYISQYEPARIQSFVCIVNLNNWEKNNVSEPTASISHIGRILRGWIVFPWEKQAHV